MSPASSPRARPAGADGVFVPGATEPDVLREVTAGLTAPVNTLVIPGLTVDELAALGVRQVSTYGTSDMGRRCRVIRCVT
jgi:2-methylisocitrate lyase-like PEP mutase family enzyme